MYSFNGSEPGFQTNLEVLEFEKNVPKLEP
jgi:hypothetical protein